MRVVLKRQEALHDAWGIVTPNCPQFLQPRRVSLRCELLMEEANEARMAMRLSESAKAGAALEAVAKELADVVVVTAGAALEFGIPLDRVLAEVMRSNESKLGPDGRPVLRADGKVLKGPNYRPPDLARALWGRR